MELLIGGTRPLFSLPAYGLLALASLLTVFSFRRPDPAASFHCLLVSVVFVGMILLRCFFSPVDYLASSDLNLVLSAAMVYLLFALILTGGKLRLIFVMFLLAIGLIHVVTASIQHLRGERFTLFDFIQPADYGLRATGLYICPNHLAGYLEVVAMMGLSIVCWSRQNIWVKILAGYGAVVCFAGIVLTGSRGGYLSTGFGLVVFLVLSFLILRQTNRQRMWLAVVGSLVVAGVLLAGTALVISKQYSLKSRAERIFTKQDGRFDLWKSAVEQAKLKPVFGTGAGSYQYYARLFRPAQTQADPVYAHNDYLQLLAEYGLVGLVAGLAFLFCHWWWGWKVTKQIIGEHSGNQRRLQSDTLALNIGALTSVAIYAVHSLVDFNLHIPANALLMAFVFAMLANHGGTMPLMRGAADRASRCLKLALPAIAIWIMAGVLPAWPSEYFSEKARIAYKEERFSESIALAERGLASDQTNPFLWRYLGQSQFSLAEVMTNSPPAQALFASAVKSFRNGLKHYPQEQWLLLGLATSLDGLGRFAEAKPVYQEAVRWNPTSGSVHLYYANHLRLAGELSAAEAAYKKSLELSWSFTVYHILEDVQKAKAASGQP